MSVAKPITLSAESDGGIEDAIRQGITKANETLRNIEGAWVKDIKVDVKDGQIVGYRIYLEVTFVLD